MTSHAKLIERVNRIKVGHPLDPATEVGPLIHKVHFDKVCSYFDMARADGATIAAGGAALDQPGYYVRPTLFTGARPEMRIAQEEIFGPVLTAIPFETEDEALEIANDVAYGLTGYVWTNDLTRALRVTACAGGRDDLGEFGKRAPPAHALWRGQGQRHRPRWRRLVV